MIRSYLNKKIYKNFKITLCLSIISLVVAIVSAIAHACAFFLREPNSANLTQIDKLILFYSFMIMLPVGILIRSVRSVKPIEQGACETIKETKLNNDFADVLTIIIVSFSPYVLLAFYGFLYLCFGSPNPAGWAYLCGYMLPAHIFVYVADIFLVINCVLIKREWKDRPPEFVTQALIEKEKQQKEKEKQKADMQKKHNEAFCLSQLQKCGMRFFIKYYGQIKALPLRDVIIAESYSPEEKDERLTAAKRIIDLNLGSVALNTIIEVYGESLGDEEIEQARALLDDTTPDQST